MTSPEKESPTLELSKLLISKPSITPKDAGCQDIMIKRLEAIGFKIEKMPFGDVDNFWARKGQDKPLFAFAGHTDVVPTGPEEEWSNKPFDPLIDNAYLYGRGAADMKGSLAAMVTACERFVEQHPDHNGSIAFLITSDEEGPATDGTVRVIEQLQERKEHIDWCVVGEPSSSNKVGDVIKNGRRGSLGCELTVHGIQGHVAYPHKADNPIHRVAPALLALNTEVWCQGNDFFPPTSFQVSNINAGTGATNVIPGKVDIVFNFRFSSELNEDIIKQRTENILDQHGLKYDIKWTLSGNPFLTSSGRLIDATVKAIKKVANINTDLSTAGGTSDGRFIAPTGTELIELGPCNDTIHKVNECVKAEDLDSLSDMYERILFELLIE